MKNQLNLVEEIHQKEINSKNIPPEYFHFESQLKRKDFFQMPKNAETENYFKSLKDYAVSKYELVDFLVFYYQASQAVEKAIEMSFDTYEFNSLDFNLRIATDTRNKESKAFVAYKEKSKLKTGSNSYDLVWCSVALMNTIDSLIKFFIYSTCKTDDYYQDLFDIAQLQDKKSIVNVIERLCQQSLINSFTEQGEIICTGFPFTSELAKHCGIYIDQLKTALTTFIVGHECGHLLLGHSKSFDDKVVIHKYPGKLTPQLKQEMESDIIGLTLMWDGCANVPNKLPIDISYMLPFLVLAYFIARIEINKNMQLVDAYMERWFSLTFSIINNLEQANFERYRIDRIKQGIPLWTYILYQWIVSDYDRFTGKKETELNITFLDDLMKVMQENF